MPLSFEEYKEALGPEAANLSASEIQVLYNTMTTFVAVLYKRWLRDKRKKLGFPPKTEDLS